MEIKRITRFSKDVFLDINKLLLQLSSSNRQISEKQLKELFLNKSVFLFGLYDESNMIGTGTLIKANQITGVEGYIESVVVDQEYRGKGLGKKLMDFIVHEARNMGCNYLTLTSNPKRKVANNMYKSLGFSIYKTNVYEMDLDKHRPVKK